MKTIIAVLLAAGLAGLAAYLVVSKREAAKLAEAQAAWDQEKLHLQEMSQKQPERRVVVQKIVTENAPASVGESPSDILNDLLAIKLGTGSARNPALRKIVYKLELLAAHGAVALPAIHDFSSRNVDVPYDPMASDAETGTNATAGDGRRGFGGGGGDFRGSRRGDSRRARDLTRFDSDWVAPPTLRLGVIGALKQIGGEGAEQELAYMLGTTGRGVEVAYLTVTLEQMAPGKYRDAAITAAKELLMTPASGANFDRLDALAKSYLYGVLEFYKDTSFVVNAQQMLVGADGRLNQDALDYLSQALKDQSVSVLYAVYQNPSFTNQMDRYDVGREILGFVGQNAQANQFLTETLANKDIDSRMKTFAVMRLAGGGFGPGSSDTPVDPQLANSRVQLLTTLQPQFASDESMSRVITATIASLQSGQPIDYRQLFGGGGGGGRRGGGGN